MVYGHIPQTPSPIGNYSAENQLVGAGSRIGNTNLAGLTQLAKDGTYLIEKMKTDNSIQFDAGVEGPRKTYQDSAKLLDGWA